MIAMIAMIVSSTAGFKWRSSKPLRVHEEMRAARCGVGMLDARVEVASVGLRSVDVLLGRGYRPIITG
jgi:hypothetical protein